MGGLEQEEFFLARRLWMKFKSESVFAKYTPFFVCLASGKLNSDTFRHFISQDVHFLRAFAKAYELAEECADDEEDKNWILKLRKRVKEKLKTHHTFVREWGFELPEEEEEQEGTPINATLKFTDFLLATASGKVAGNIATPFEKTKVAAYTLGAMAPCMRLYAFISKEIQGLIDPDDTTHIYKKWVDNICSQDFEATAVQMEEMLDRLSVSLTGEELKVIEKMYHQAMKLELEFFSTQPIVQQTILPLSRVAKCPTLTIFCDFDLTCTAFDSSAILAEIAIVTVPKAANPQTQLSRMSSADLRNTWAVLSTQYTQEYEQCIESILPSETVEKFNYQSLCKALQQIADFEKNVNSRVVQSEVLKGLNLDDIKRAGHHLILQDGCESFFQKVVGTENLKSDVHVLSYCWCGDLIRSAFTSGDLNVLQVHSNELAYEESISTGEIVRKVESPMEKLKVFNSILMDRSNDDHHLTVYIGGSVGDLLCLLQADIGIVMGSSSSLRKLGDHFGVSFVPLFSALVEKQRELVEGGSSNWKGLSGTLYTVSSWAEIQAFILGS